MAPYIDEEAAEEMLDELRLDYDDKVNELADMKAELRAIKLEAQQSRLRLQAAGLSTTSVQAEIRQPPSAPADPAEAEMLTFLSWLAAHVDLRTPAVVFESGCDINVGGRLVHIQRVAQWPLRLAGDLKLSVPAEAAADFSHLLQAIGAKDVEGTRAVAKAWELVAKEAFPGCHAERPEPVILLAHRETSAGLLVATWPRPPVVAARPRSQTWGTTSQWNIQRPRGDRRAPCRRPSSCPPRLGRGPLRIPIAVGDRVELNYQGQWFAGKVWAIDEQGFANVQCDADPPEVVTRAPTDLLRVLQDAQAAPAVGSPVASAASPAASRPAPEGIRQRPALLQLDAAAEAGVQPKARLQAPPEVPLSPASPAKKARA